MRCISWCEGYYRPLRSRQLAWLHDQRNADVYRSAYVVYLFGLLNVPLVITTAVEFFVPILRP